MGISLISFTENGMRLSEKIAGSLDMEKVSVYTKWSGYKADGVTSPVRFVEKQIFAWAKEQMEEKNVLLFIGACGIAVRAIAPCITDKLHDSPVLVMDEGGKYIIPILSGHMGGANEIALRIAAKMGVIPVITTATDINGRFAVDLFAKRNDLYIVNMDGIAKVSAKVLAGKEITVSVDPEYIEEKGKTAKGVIIVSYPPKHPVDVVITTEEKNFQALLRLKPREYAIGIGCKKGKEAEKLEKFIFRAMRETGITKEQVFALASVDRKKDEEGLLTWSRRENIPFLTFSAEQLQEVAGKFHDSAFVKRQVGVDNVCERAALKVCGPDGRLIYEKHAEEGMTIAIAKRERRVSFDEE